MDFGFEVSEAQSGSSTTFVSGGAKGLQLLVVVGSTSQEENTVNVAVVAVDKDSNNEQASQECIRVEALPAENTSIVTIYPGIAEAGSAQFGRQVSAAVPPQFQVQLSNALGLDMTVNVLGSFIE